jgi:magnesium-protoporphyrin IX monomethyl ester (oxidative) cyclase
MEQKALKPIRRVMLIFPPMFDVKYMDTMTCPPLGIAYLGAFVRDMVDIKLMDALIEAPYNRKNINENMELVGLSYDDIIARVREYEPDLVGFSCVFSGQFASIKELASRIKKEIDPETVLVAGGTHPSFLPERSLNQTELDYIVIGEGELTFRDLILAHNKGHGIEDIDGLAYRNGDAIKVNPRVNLVENLDDLPFPARDLLPMEKYFKVNIPMGLHWMKKPNTPIITSRGCPCKCAFCSSTLHWGKRYRCRSPENVLSEIEHLKDTYGVRELKFQDDNLTMPRKRARAIFQGMVDRGLAMPWNTPNGVAIWTLDDDMLKLMRQSGCYELTLAVESGDPWVLKNIVKKPLKLEKAMEVSRLARKNKIVTMGYFVIGFPGEKMENIHNTLQFMKDLYLDYTAVFIYNPLPGSELWQVCKDNGYIPEDYHYEEANNYFQSDLDTEDFDSQELHRLQAKAYVYHLIRSPIRNPGFFFKYQSRVFLTRPSYLRTFFLGSIQRVKINLNRLKESLRGEAL